MGIFTTALLWQTVEYFADIVGKSCHKRVVLLQTKEEETSHGNKYIKPK